MLHVHHRPWRVTEFSCGMLGFLSYKQEGFLRYNTSTTDNHKSQKTMFSNHSVLSFTLYTIQCGRDVASQHSLIFVGLGGGGGVGSEGYSVCYRTMYILSCLTSKVDGL
jgi:hypothetical protein